MSIAARRVDAAEPRRLRRGLRGGPRARLRKIPDRPQIASGPSATPRRKHQKACDPREHRGAAPRQVQREARGERREECHGRAERGVDRKRAAAPPGAAAPNAPTVSEALSSITVTPYTASSAAIHQNGSSAANPITAATTSDVSMKPISTGRRPSRVATVAEHARGQAEQQDQAGHRGDRKPLMALPWATAVKVMNATSQVRNPNSSQQWAA